MWNNETKQNWLCHQGRRQALLHCVPSARIYTLKRQFDAQFGYLRVTLIELFIHFFSDSFFIKQLYWGYSVTNTYYFTNHWHFFIDTMQVLQKNSRYDGQFLEVLRKLNSRLQQNFSSKPQEKSSSLMSPYKHYSTDLQLTFLGTIFFFQIRAHFTKVGVFQT